MIIGNYIKLIPAQHLITILTNALKGVVKIKMGTNSLATGWLITDTLVLVPDYAFDKADSHPVMA